MGMMNQGLNQGDPQAAVRFAPTESRSFIGVAAWMVLGSCGIGAAGGLRAESPVSFARDIRPILSNNCFMCHGPDEHERKGGPDGSGGLRLDTEEGARMDLGSGRASVVPGHPESSDLMARVTTHIADDLMPPPKSGKKLTPAEIELLSRWIAQGGSYSRHWSYEPPVRPPVPAVAGHPVDAFVRDRLSKEGLKPQPEADRATLARRAALDLTGLPPSPDLAESFLTDAAPGAFERYVDRLLGSPAYGEHWARQWLDLARYADSAGYADDPPRTIWAFRDYVIRSFNANKPFDQFTIEQIAGDLLPGATDDQVIATAFHRNTMTNSEGGTDDEEYRNAAIVDRVNTTLATWMGTSMACAQCHTHKYDPITQKEYFQVFAIFNNTADADQRDESPLLNFYADEQKAQRRAIEASLAQEEARFRSPPPEVQASAARWIEGFSEPIAWRPLVPSAVRSTAGSALDVSGDGVVSTAAGAVGAARDTYAVDLPVSGRQRLTAMRIEALPHESLPRSGPGLAGGNFVLTRAHLTVLPPPGTPGPVARFVRVELPGRDRLLQLAEVQVFSGGGNVAAGGVATQKSTYADAAAARAIDGNTDGAYNNGSVAHTGVGTDDPWWEVDLLEERPLERLVVWNRIEAAERLEGFRVVALDARREVVWQRSENPAARESVITLDGSREIRIADAVATYGQPGFDVDAVVAASPSGDQNQRGWAIGGRPGEPHSLLLIFETPVEVPAGATVRLTLDQQSPFDGHTLGRFALFATEDPAASRWAGLPPSIATTLALPVEKRTDAASAEAVAYFIENRAPELEAARQARAELKKRLQSIPAITVPVFRELPVDKRRVTKVQLRGNRLTPGDTVTEGVPAAWHPLPPGAPMDRLALARWLVDRDNPLTARVTANRYWESLFGVGLVRTSEEFGAQGELPSHPELLDWLATELVRLHWDVKAFLRLLVTSQTYRQSSRIEPGAADRDPDNRLLARGPRLRLSAEMVRDQALAVSGLLSKKMYGPSVRPARPALGLSAAFGGGLDWQPSEGEDRLRRGLYTEWRRTSPYPSMTTFDAPNREVCTLRRSQTNTPLQALVTLNDPVFVETAQALARLLVTEAGSPDAIIDRAFRRVLLRPPTLTEGHRLKTLHHELVADYRQDAARAMAMASQPLGPPPEGSDIADLAAWSAVAGVILNLDETLMKR